ncbi:unnamed protein product [Adineta ricciae]|uniref:Sperm-tail PG-rich repeat-containing protein 2 n=1 Tax=Adineta ricciae TaxID=249248 RepID=A0A815HEW4_ADIRI|nr:unnamed protein product [Adineta ricciae]
MAQTWSNTLLMLRILMTKTSKQNGACTLSNRASRFSQNPSKGTPGPGYYEVYSSQSPHTILNDPLKASVKITRKCLPPSIPDPKYSYGFEEDDDGNLIPHDQITADTRTSQDVSNVKENVEKDPSKLYQGVHFGKYSSKRTDFAAKPGPGPGDYDISSPLKLEVYHINTKLLDKRSELKLPRYPESMMKTATKDGIPGPGQYSIKRELDPEPSKPEIIGIEVDRPPFGSQTQRFADSSTDVPGPGAYNDKFLSIFNSSQVKPTTIKQVPFNQTTSRFVSPNYRTRSLPGPAQYRIAGFADENLRQAVKKNGKKPPFNVASVRRFNMAPKDETERPGPTTYDVKTEPFKPTGEHPTANFASNTARDLVIEDIPGPAAYDVPHAYQSLVSQPRKSPRTKAARQRQSQFLSAAKRTYASDTDVDIPGPGTYDSLAPLQPRGYAPVRASRFRNEIPKMPGPADYELSPLLQDTVLRGTFNATLNNPILAKIQERALREDEAMLTAAS